jgi:type I restriction enzyme S subunit
VGRCLDVADTVERHAAAASARSDALVHCILAKAFRGELIPTEAELARGEGRDYESTTALLARIQGASAPPAKRGRRPARRAGARP